LLTARDGHRSVQVNGADAELGLGERDAPSASVREGERLTVRVGRPCGERLEGDEVAARRADARRARREEEEEGSEAPLHTPPRVAVRVRNTPRGAPAVKWRDGTSVG